jgi:hypothetical protein
MKLYSNSFLWCLKKLFFKQLQFLFVQSGSWLRQYATSGKVAGSIPDEVIGFFS